MTSPEQFEDDETQQAVASLLHKHRSALVSPLPSDLEQHVRASLYDEARSVREESDAISNVYQLPFTDSLSRKWPMVACVALLAGACLWWMVGEHSSSRMQVVDVQKNAYSNFAAILSGELHPSITSSDTGTLNTYFRNAGVAHPLHLSLHSGTLTGGVVSYHRDFSCAHLIYKYHDQVVYVFEVDEQDLREGKVSFSHDAQEAIRNNTMYVDVSNPVGTLVIWKSNNVVCSAVSKLGSTDLTQLLAQNTL